MTGCPVEKKGGFPPGSRAFPQEISETADEKTKSVVFDPSAIRRLTEKEFRSKGNCWTGSSNRKPLQ
tara:strand:- start:214 stop:414 length:201 start_codon:yes stop_codon:yes gene_type:complete